MKIKIFLSVLLILFVSSYATDKSKIRISFNGDVFVKDIPKDYYAAISTIRSLEALFNVLDSSYSTLYKKYNRIVYNTGTSQNNVMAYIDKVDSLLSAIDSLNGVIVNKSNTMQTNIDEYSKIIDSISVKRTWNFGVSGNASSSFSPDGTSDFSIMPMVIYKKAFIGASIGLYSEKWVFSRKFGLTAGLFVW